MNNPKLNLPVLLAARICHDLISPVGAINNGLELMQMSGDLSGPEAGLIADSAENATARLRYYRLAFGMYGSGQTISGNELASIVTSHYSEAGFTVQMNAADGMTRTRAQVVFLLLMCCETAVMRRGSVMVNGLGHIECTGQSPLTQHGLIGDLVQDNDWPTDLGAADVHFPLARAALIANGLRLNCDRHDRTLTLWTEPALPDLQINREPSRPRRQGT